MSQALPPILYRDERLLALDKPAGLLSVPGIGPEKADCLASRVGRAHPGARIVHRLDRDTSGVIVMALDAEAHRALSIQFQTREVEKTYVAVVDGRPAGEAGIIDAALRKDPARPPLQMIDYVRGRSAVTAWRVLEHAAGLTRLQLTPRTGRSHQLRLHLRTIGHPILGDDLYAPPAVRDAADRLLLHAVALAVVHPSSGVVLRFEAGCPF